jgi:hypothetical protein
MSHPAPYTAHKAPPPETPEQLRARIPGWGVDADPRDRPSVPQERPGTDTGAHWDFPERQAEEHPRERSVEHAMLTPVFGTAAPLQGLSGVIRRYAYRRFSEGRAAHWLLLVAADRVDVVESMARGGRRGRPDNPLMETGLRSELTYHGWSSRSRKERADTRHQLLDPLLKAAPWLLAAAAAWATLRHLHRP